MPGKPFLSHGGFLHGQLTRAKGLVPLDGERLDQGDGLFPKPLAIQGRKALGIARLKPVQKSAVAKLSK